MLPRSVLLAALDRARHGILSLDRRQRGCCASRRDCWLRGGFPRSYPAWNDGDRLIWRHDFIRTLLESDLPQLAMRVPAPTMQRFWDMVAHFHGQLSN